MSCKMADSLQVPQSPASSNSSSPVGASIASTSGSSIDESNLVDLVFVDSGQREQLLIRLFEGNTITQEDIEELGVILGVGLDGTNDIISKNRSNTMAAVLTCCKWLEKDADKLDKKSAFKQLRSALQRINHGRIAERLIQLDRSRASTISGTV